MVMTSTAGVTAMSGVTPGSGNVTVYQLTTGGTLTQFSTDTETLYNLSPRPLPASSYLTAHQDNWGDFYAPPPGSSVRYGVLENDVQNRFAERARLVTQTGTVAIGASDTYEWISPTEWVTCYNFTGVTLAGGNTGAANPLSEPIMEIKYVADFDMPVIEMYQVELCTQP